MVKALRYMFFTLLAMVCGTTYAVETVTWSASSGNSLSSAIAVDDNITLTWSESSGDQAPKYSGSSVYFYNGNQVKLTAASGYQITKIEFTFSQGSSSLTVLTGGGSYSGGIWTGEAGEVSLRAAKQTGVRYISAIAVTYKQDGEVVETHPDMTVSATINSTADLDNTPSVWVTYKNQGDAVAENVVLTLYVDGVVNRTATVSTVNAGATSYTSLYYDAEKIDAGTHQVYVGITADNDGTTGVKQTEATTVTFTKKAPEATFTFTVANTITVAYDATSYDVVVNVTNTSVVDATGVEVKLMRGMTTLASSTVDVAAGATQEVTLTVSGGPFAAGTTEMQVWVGTKDAKYINVTVEEAPVTPVYDLAITGMMGTIDLAQANNYLTVAVQNNGNQDITDAAVTVKAGDQVLGSATVSAKAGSNGFCSVAIDKTNLEAGELSVVASVEVEGDATPADNTLTQTVTVKAVPAPQATYSVTASNVTVPYGAGNFEIKATVKNTSEVDATNVEVKLMKSITLIETKTVAALAAGAETEVTFTVAATEEAPFAAGTTASYFVQVANVAQAEVTVTFEAEPVAEVKDLAITAISGTIDLAEESNMLSVYVENKGNVDITDAKVTLTAGGKTLGEGTVSAKAGEHNTGWCQIAVATDGLEEGELQVTATVEVEGETDDVKADNTLTQAVQVVRTVVEPTYSVAASNVTVAYDAVSYTVIAQVTNTNNVAAESVDVQLLDGTDVIASTTVAVPAGETVEAQLTVENGPFTAGSYEMQVVVANKASQWITVVVEEAPVTPVVDLAITDVSGSIDLEQEVNYLTVFVENHGNQDVADAPVVITTAEGDVLGQNTVTVKAGNSQICSVSINTAGLQAGNMEVKAAVTVEGDATPDDNEFEKSFSITTAIQAIRAQYGEHVEVYTIAGQKVNTVGKGLYIVNGRKVVVK